MSEAVHTLRHSFPERLLGDAKVVAFMASLSVRTVRRLDYGGEMPAPKVRKKRRVLWYLPEIRAWIEAGMPSREKWEAKA